MLKTAATGRPGTSCRACPAPRRSRRPRGPDLDLGAVGQQSVSAVRYVHAHAVLPPARDTATQSALSVAAAPSGAPLNTGTLHNQTAAGSCPASSLSPLAGTACRLAFAGRRRPAGLRCLPSARDPVVPESRPARVTADSAPAASGVRSSPGPRRNLWACMTFGAAAGTSAGLTMLCSLVSVQL
jgi:hypothetical protein